MFASSVSGTINQKIVFILAEHFIRFNFLIHLLTFLAAAATQEVYLCFVAHSPLRLTTLALPLFPPFCSPAGAIDLSSSISNAAFLNNQTKKNKRKWTWQEEGYKNGACEEFAHRKWCVKEGGRERERTGRTLLHCVWGDGSELREHCHFPQTQRVKVRTQQTGRGFVCGPSSPLCFSACQLIGTLAC